jgi:hypothetical protein
MQPISLRKWVWSRGRHGILALGLGSIAIAGGCETSNPFVNTSACQSCTAQANAQKKADVPQPSTSVAQVQATSSVTTPAHPGSPQAPAPSGPPQSAMGDPVVCGFGFTPALAVMEDVQHGHELVAGIQGRMYLFDAHTHTICSNGTLKLYLYNEKPAPGVDSSKPIEGWAIDADTLRRLANQDKIGWGYTLFLPTWGITPAVSRVRLVGIFETPDGRQINGGAVRLTINYTGQTADLVTKQARMADLERQQASVRQQQQALAQQQASLQQQQAQIQQSMVMPQQVQVQPQMVAQPMPSPAPAAQQIPPGFQGQVPVTQAPYQVPQQFQQQPMQSVMPQSVQQQMQQPVPPPIQMPVMPQQGIQQVPYQQPLQPAQMPVGPMSGAQGAQRQAQIGGPTN